MGQTNDALAFSTYHLPRRRSLRRGVFLPCEVRSELWDGPVQLTASNLSPEGMWLETPMPLDEGEELLVSFSPPGQFLRLHALCEVSRVGLWRRLGDPWPSGMGVVFTDLTPADHRRLARALIGIPPPLPLRGIRRRIRKPRRCAEGVSTERGNEPGLPAVLDPDAEGELVWRAISEPLTGGVPRRSFRM